MLMLLDKGYYDYDFKFIEKPNVVESVPLSDEKMHKLLSKFGIGGKSDSPEEINAETLQEHAMKGIDK